LKVDNNQSFPNNNNGAITPSILRAFNTNMIDSMVDEISYNVDSASWNQQIDALEQFSASASGLTTGSLLVTASAAGNVITFTKGNNTTFNVTVATGSIPDISNLNQATASLQQFTASAQVSINNLNTTTASLNSSVSQLNASSASQQVSINNLNTTTASLLVETQNLELFSASALVSISNLNQSSASQQISIDNLNSKTGSYATTGSNTFVGANTFTSISASSFVSASEFIGNGSKITGITASIALPILDEGIPQGNAFSMNFTGSGISAVVVGGTAVVSVNTPDSGTINNLTASFNEYTSSTNAFTASSNTSASLALYTASFDTGSRNLTFTKGDTQTFSVNIPDVSGSTGNFATTGSNTFIGDQTISGSLFVSGSEVVAGPVTASRLQINGVTDLNGTLDVSNDATFRGDVLIQSSGEQKLKMRSTSGGGVSQGFDLLIQTSSFIIRDETHGIDFLNFDYISSSADHILKLEANRFELNSGSLGVSGSFTASLQEGFTYVGNASGRTTTVATSSFATTIDTGSFATTASFNSYTSSNDQKVDSLISATGSYATTGSNSFIGNQIITGNVTISGSATTDLTVVGQIYVSSSATTQTTQPRIIVSGSSGQTTILRNQINTNNGTNSAGLNPLAIFNSVIATNDEIGFSVDPVAGGVSGWTTGPAIYVNNDALDTYPAVFGFQNKVNYTDGRVAVLTPLSASAGFTASLQNGYAWVGNSLGQNTQVATSSFGTAINTGSFATTGSNTFVGDQYISNGVLQVATYPQTGKTWFAPTAIEAVGTQSVAYEQFVDGGGYDAFNVVTTLDSGSEFRDLPSDTFVLNTWLQIPRNTGNNPAPQFKRGLSVTGSTEVGTFTASLQQGFVYVGNASGITTTVSTSSFGGGGAAFPYTGSAQITGSLGVTGSMSGFVNTLTISSNTASLDFNDGNFFTLQLVSGSITHLTATNIRPGQTINLLVKTDSGSAAATGSLTFSPTFKFAGGFDYTPTAITASQDLVSFVTFDTTQILAAQVKNLS
jgi:hypothetical protein